MQKNMGLNGFDDRLFCRSSFFLWKVIHLVCKEFNLLAKSGDSFPATNFATLIPISTK